jgi:hypothetical protein
MAGVLRVMPLWNALSCASGWDSAGSGEVCSISTGDATTKVYAGLHLLGSTAAAQTWTMAIESATACAFAAPTTRFAFTARACNGAQFMPPIAQPTGGSTDTLFWRATVNPAATTDFRLGVIWLSVQ